jgi:hypothetical protein
MSPFDAPGVIHHTNTANQSRCLLPHPLAPKMPPPPPLCESFVPITASAIPTTGTHLGAASIVSVSSFLALLSPLVATMQSLTWQLNYIRKGPRVATRLQKLFRGNRARRHVHALRMQHMYVIAWQEVVTRYCVVGSLAVSCQDTGRCFLSWFYFFFVAYIYIYVYPVVKAIIFVIDLRHHDWISLLYDIK